MVGLPGKLETAVQFHRQGLPDFTFGLAGEKNGDSVLGTGFLMVLAVAAVFAVQNGVRQGQGARQAVAYACQRGGTAAFRPADGEDLQDKHWNLFCRLVWVFRRPEGEIATLPFKTAVQNMLGACMGRCGGAIRCLPYRVLVGQAVCVLHIFVIRQTVFQTALGCFRAFSGGRRRLRILAGCADRDRASAC